MALRLAAGGKALMVLLGLTIIALGLWYGGLRPGGEGPGAREEGSWIDPEVPWRPAEKETRPEKVPDTGPTTEESPVPSLPSGELGPHTVPPAEQHHLASSEGDAIDPKAGPPPPLFAESPAPLRATRFAGEREVRELLQELMSGSVDVVEIELHDLIESTLPTSGLVLVGARPPKRRLFLCAEEYPLDSLESGSRVSTQRVSHRILVAHVAEAKNMDLDGIIWVEDNRPPAIDGEAELWVLYREEEGLECACLHSMKVQGPSLLLARKDAVRLYGRSYLELAEEMGALGDSARSYLLGPLDDHQSYASKAAYLFSLSSRLQHRPPVSPPEVAEWLVKMEE